MRPTNGKILAINAGYHDAAVVYLDGTTINFAVEEERLTRIKAGLNCFAVPETSYQKCKEIFPEIRDKQNISIVHSLPMNLDFAKKIGITNCESVGHHDSHAYGAYFTSGIKEKCLVISLDGGGYSSLGRYYIAENGIIKQIHRYDYYEGWSPANFYSTITQLLGWTAIKDEGKVVGLAGNGSYNEKLYLALSKMIEYKDGDFYSPMRKNQMDNDRINIHCNLIARNLFNKPNGKALLAYNGQLLFENLMIELFEDLHKQFPEYDSVVVSGGPFANVKSNKKINELPWVKQMYVYPPMGDMGLALGSAIKKSIDIGYWTIPIPFKNMFFGLEYSSDDIYIASKSYDFIIESYDVKKVANLLDDNKIVGFFQGKFEHGPRALGARSILMKVTEKDGFEKLNNRLGRNEVMPFAPVILDEYADIVFNITKSRYTAEFMTMCFDTKEEWIGKIPAVVHSCDNTSRPQIVVKENNSKFYEIVDEYRKVSGIPLLLNTSFNGHNEPIIDTPTQAMEHLQKGSIDYLVIENFLMYKK